MLPSAIPIRAILALATTPGRAWSLGRETQTVAKAEATEEELLVMGRYFEELLEVWVPQFNSSNGLYRYNQSI